MKVEVFLFFDYIGFSPHTKYDKKFFINKSNYDTAFDYLPPAGYNINYIET